MTQKKKIRPDNVHFLARSLGVGIYIAICIQVSNMYTSQEDNIA